MTVLSFSNTSLIALNQLESQMRREFGVRHNLSQDASLFELIQMASTSRNSKIRKAFKFFESSLDLDQKKALTYRGVKFDKAEHTGQSVSSDKPKVYRGVVSQADKSVTQESTLKDKKAVIYRGQRISED
ncbi:DUF4278 domain-containing protein [Sessilibacter corallicola]|uniref:Uncharacterized protein n=1 Tax=Sessilibacter corallicola TaxID=2904075 RepID=A0ABQ0A6L7_9GAMM